MNSGAYETLVVTKRTEKILALRSDVWIAQNPSQGRRSQTQLESGSDCCEGNAVRGRDWLRAIRIRNYRVLSCLRA